MFILASGSQARADMLRNAGVSVETQVAHIDETQVKDEMLAEGAGGGDIALRLADLKARKVAKGRPDALVLGADQVLVCQEVLFDKPRTILEARAQLTGLRGKTHELLSAAVIYENGAPVWQGVGQARLKMRNFSEAFLDMYIEQLGKDLLTTVGGYKLEGLGAQLFAQVEGDYFTVLGLPLLEVLEELRTRGVCEK